MHSVRLSIVGSPMHAFNAPLIAACSSDNDIGRAAEAACSSDNDIGRAAERMKESCVQTQRAAESNTVLVLASWFVRYFTPPYRRGFLTGCQWTFLHGRVSTAHRTTSNLCSLRQQISIGHSNCHPNISPPGPPCSSSSGPIHAWSHCVVCSPMRFLLAHAPAGPGASRSRRKSSKVVEGRTSIYPRARPPARTVAPARPARLRRLPSPPWPPRRPRRW